jgi:hypothetical protein
MTSSLPEEVSPESISKRLAKFSSRNKSENLSAVRGSRRGRVRCRRATAGSTSPPMKSATRRAKRHISGSSLLVGRRIRTLRASRVTGSPHSRPTADFAAKRSTREGERGDVFELRHRCQRSHSSETAAVSANSGSSSVSPSSAHPRTQTATTRAGPHPITLDPTQRYRSSPQARGTTLAALGGRAAGGLDGRGAHSWRFARETGIGASKPSTTHPLSHRSTTSHGHAHRSAGPLHGSG